MATAKHTAPAKAVPFAVLERKTIRATDRSSALIKACLEHPESIAREAARKEAAERAKSEPEFAQVIEEIIEELYEAKGAVLTVAHALDDIAGESTCVSSVIKGAANTLTEQITRLEHAVKHARIRGSKMVVVKDEEAAS